jgi:hypothetical protein
LVGTAAVVVSLIYVGLQVRQNTAAIQTSTSQDVYQLHQDRSLIELQDPEFAELLLRATRSPQTMTPVDSLRYNRYLNLLLNLQESVYTNALQGTMEEGLAAGWLDGMAELPCRPGMHEYWRQGKLGYQPAFRAAMDSVFALVDCSE